MAFFNYNSTVTAESNDDYHKFFNKVVQVPTDQKKAVVTNVVENVKQLLRGCNAQDKRVAKEPRCVGSSWQGLKTKDPFEYDVNVYFGIPDVSFGGGCSIPRASFRLQDMETEEIFWEDKPLKKSLKCYNIISTAQVLPDPPKGHVSLPSTGDEDEGLNSKFAFQGHIVPFLVKSHFRLLLENSLRDNKSRLSGERNSLQKGDHGPANTLSTDFKVGSDPDARLKTVTVDITPCIHVTNFPDDIKWPRSGALWPSADKVRKIKAMGVNLVAKKNYHWTISFSECEKELAYNMDVDRGERKKCHRIIKSINEDFWYISKPHKKNPLSTYALKNIWFWECEKLPYASSWTNCLMEQRIHDMMEVIFHCLEKAELFHYFNSDNNMLQGVNSRDLHELADKIHNFRVNDEKLIRARIAKYGRN